MFYKGNSYSLYLYFMSAFYLTRRICNGYVFARPLFRDVLRPTTPSEAFA